MNQPEHAIVLAVGPEDVETALDFALGEARRRHRPLHLVHVLQIPAGEAYAGVYGGAVEVASQVLDAAHARARELAGGDVPVTAELVDRGFVVDELVRRSRGAHLVVLQHRDLGRVRRMLSGSISGGVAAKAHAPVVSVPEAPTPTGSARIVTAAVQAAAGSEPVLRAAFEEARERGLPLVVLHAWWVGDGYGDVGMSPEVLDEAAARWDAELAPVLTPLRERYPGVEVRSVVRHAPPAEAVLDAAENSDVLVIARRHHLLPLGTHLGPVARAVLGRGACPVLVTPEAEAQPVS